ncbi:MAG TPA: putative quinol monooxygenase [Candidatus Dormibacteraeota bacterium]|nr:putative quinol monooxygenase [Candidatus Dormibacteraeota bacterium]
MSESTLTLTVRLQARDGQAAALEQELFSLVAPTRAEEGCLTYDLYRAAETPGLFMLHEAWTSREHHTRHTRTPHFLHWNERKDSLLADREASFWNKIR